MITSTIVKDPPVLTTEGGLIQGGVDPQLDRYRDAMNNGKNGWLKWKQMSGKRQVLIT